MAHVQMDIEQVKQFGNELKGTFTEQMQSLKSTLSSKSNGLNWEGPDAQQFKNDRTPALLSAIDNVITQLSDLGTYATNNAVAQESTSQTL